MTLTEEVMQLLIKAKDEAGKKGDAADSTEVYLAEWINGLDQVFMRLVHEVDEVRSLAVRHSENQ